DKRAHRSVILPSSHNEPESAWKQRRGTDRRPIHGKPESQNENKPLGYDKDGADILCKYETGAQKNINQGPYTIFGLLYPSEQSPHRYYREASTERVRPCQLPVIYKVRRSRA